MCDSDESSNSSPIIPMKTKTRLIFDDSSDDELNNRNENNKSTERNDDEKENVDLSDTSKNLGEKIRKKMDKFPVVSTENKMKTKKKQKQNSVKIKKKNVILDESDETDECTKKDILKSKNENKKSCSVSSELNCSSDDDEEWDRRISTITSNRPTNGSYSFLASLSGN